MKLSELMKKGAEGILQTEGTFFQSNSNGEITRCCALGAAILGNNPDFKEGDESANDWIEAVEKAIGYSIRTKLIPVEDLPEDINHIWRHWTGTKFVVKRVPLFDVIVSTNDKISRERAIQLVEELGY